MSRYDLKIDGVPYAVEIAEISGGRATVRVNGISYRVELPTGGTSSGTPAPAVRSAVAPEAAAPGSGPAPVLPPCDPGAGEAIVAPMPGQVLEVLVKEGDPVEAGSTVLLMEAMKMENEIKSHVAGRIVSVRAAKGQSVSVNEVLVLIGR